MPPGQSLASTPPEVLVAGITGTCFKAALIIFLSTVLAASSLWIENRRRSRSLSPATRQA